jgi:hypothetical protein
MPSPFELNVGHAPSPRPARDDGGDGAPYRLLVLGDFSGRPAAGRAPLAQRRGLRVDIDELEAVFARLAPVVEIDGSAADGASALRLELGTPDDFSADALLARLPAEATAPRAPARATDPAAGEGEGEDAAATLRRLLGGSVAADAPARAAPAPAARAAGSDAIDRFIRQLAGAPSSAPAPAAAASATAPASGSAAALRRVLRDPAWRRLECAWRAVDRFVRALDMADGRVRLELLDVRADELFGDLAEAGGDPARSALAGAMAGDGRGCDLVVSLEEFGASAAELALLAGLARLAQSRGATLLAGAAPALAAVAAAEDPAVRATPEARAWAALRESELAAGIGLTFPRLLARLPYGPRDEPVAAFAFDELEDTAGPVPHQHLLWRSAALDAALLLARARADGLAQPDALLEDLPAFIDRRGDEPRLQAVAETYLGEAGARALQAAGFLTLQSDRRVPEARVSGWRSIALGDAPLRGLRRAD